MRKFMETGFYAVYLVIILVLGIMMIAKSKQKRSYILFGAAAILLGSGDAFHLVPRAIGLFTGTLDAPSSSLAEWLGIGKLVTSITMTAFYVLLYFFVFERAGKKRNAYLDIAVWLLFAARIVLCAFPQNGWLTNESPLLWGTLRNIPFTILGVLVIVLCFKYLRSFKELKVLWLAIILSFAFYLPVVFFASRFSWVGMLMLPKTVCYLWIAFSAHADLVKGEAAPASLEK